MELQTNLAQIEHLGGTVVAVTVEPLAISRSLAAQLNLVFPIVEDTGHALGSAFGVFRLPSGMDMGPVDAHSVFVIDASGYVRWKRLAPDTMHVPVDAILGALKEPMK